MAKYKVKTKNCQLVVRVKLSFKEKINVRHLDFFSGKYFRSLLKATLIKTNLIEYSGPVGVSLCERLKKPISKYDFFFIMEQIVDIVQKLNANSLIISNTVFDINNVFINEITKELNFIYLPLENTQRETNIIGFMEQIIYSCKPQPENDTEYVSRFVYYIRSLSKFDAVAIENYIQREDRSIVNTIKRHNVGQSGFITDKRADYYEHYGKKNSDKTALLNNEAGDLLDDEATDLLNDEGTSYLDDEGTSYLNDEGTSYLDDEGTSMLNERDAGLLKGNHAFSGATLYRFLTNEQIPINKPVFRIGKERSYADYFVANNDKVSRGHADIIARGNRFYIIDLNSMNGTFVNDRHIPVQQEIEIQNGDRICLANEEFEFRK